MRRLVIGLVGVVSLVVAVTGFAVAQGQSPDATLSLTEGSVAAGLHRRAHDGDPHSRDGFAGCPRARRHAGAPRVAFTGLG
jgi:hypothetical protein